MNKPRNIFVTGKILLRMACIAVPLVLATSCASLDIADGKTPKVSAPEAPLDRFHAMNEKHDPITRVKLGKDILVPQPMKEDELPDEAVGPFELRGETLASALQLILDEYDISFAFETEEGLRRKVTVSNLHGKLRDVVNRVCTLSGLYCHFEGGTMTIKETETFVVDLPPIGGSSSSSSSDSSSSSSSSSSDSSSDSGSDAYTQIAAGLAAVIGSTPTVDESTRVMIYTANQKAQKYATQYFERLRKNTALIIYETHIWEVALDHTNRTGIDWSALFSQIGNFTLDVQLPGGISPAAGQVEPIAITPTYTGSGRIDTEAVLNFISERGAVRTVSQPQITVLSGSSASLAVSQQENYVSGVSRTPSTTVGVPDTFTTTTNTITTGLTISVTSAWDQSTVYGNLNINLDDLLNIDSFSPDGGVSTVQLPQTTNRSLQTAIRVRPGDAILIGGLVSERNNLTDSGPGFMKPLMATQRNATKSSSELVFLLRPRVVAFVVGDETDNQPIVDAPKDGIATPPDLTGQIKKIFGNDSAVSKVKNGEKAALPEGLSPDAFAPQAPGAEAPPAVEEKPVTDGLPDGLQEQLVPVPQAKVPEPAPQEKNDHGGLNR